MAAEIITKEDLEQFGNKLIAEIKSIIGKSGEETTKWIKSYQVKNLLKISPNTLHKLRLDGTLKPTKIGGTLYYNHQEIMNILNGTKKAK